MSDDLELRLASLRFDYETERAHISAQAVPADPATPNICRYCGKFRTSYPGSKLDGHGMCLVGPEFRRRLVAVMQDPKITFSRVGALLGLNHSVIRQWYRAVEDGR